MYFGRDTSCGQTKECRQDLKLEVLYDCILRYYEAIPCDDRIAKAAHQVRVVAKFSKDPDGPESSHSAAQHALHLGGLQELAVQPTLVRR